MQEAGLRLHSCRGVHFQRQAVSPCQPHESSLVPLRGGLAGLQSPAISVPTPSRPLLATCFSGTTKFGVLGRKRSHVFQSKPWTGDCMCPLSGFVAGCLTDLTGSGAFPDLRFGVERGRSEAAAGGLVNGAGSTGGCSPLLLGHREL